MAVLTRDTQDQYVAMRPYRAGICFVDTSSAVHHLCFDMFSAVESEVYVFYSPETCIRSGAAASVDILILGHTRMCLGENEPLRWAGTHRPNIKNDHAWGWFSSRPSTSRPIPYALNRLCTRKVPRSNLETPQVLHLFFVSCTNARYYQTIWHGASEETCADTSTYSGEEFLRGIGRDSGTPRHVLLSDGAGVRQMLG
jgi:hypothetical protein